jgi:beta-phosphoglucomutase-like phosphatase (HAD superfamily)
MNPFLIRAVLFDVDGVLTDSEPTRFRVGAQALAEVGVPLTREAFQACWLGRTTEAALQDVLGERFARLGPQVIERRNGLYEEQMDRIDAFPDAIRLLRRMPPELRLGIATGARRGEVESILWRAALTESFGTLVTAEDYPRAKPAPDAFLVAARLLHLSPAACLVIEDSPAGVAAAQAAGMPVVAVRRDSSAPELVGATWHVTSLDDLNLSSRGEVSIRSATQSRKTSFKKAVGLTHTAALLY